jgi:uncharacterized protein YjdB
MGSTTTLANTTSGGTWASSNAALATIDASGVVTGVAAGTPVMSYTTPAGCVRTKSITVKTLPAPVSGNAAVCVAGTSVLTAETGVSWTSSTPSIATIGSTSGVVTGISAGTSTITFLATSGCTSLRIVTVSAAPDAGTITGPNTVIIGNTIALSDAVGGGTWASSDGSIATVVSGTGDVTGVSAAPSVTISYTVNNGCGAATTTATISVTTSRPAGNNANGVQLPNGGAFALYPNPTSGDVTIETSEAGRLLIYSLNGKLMASLPIVQGMNQIGMPANASAGLYMCRFEGRQGSDVTIRLVYEGGSKQ